MSTSAKPAAQPAFGLNLPSRYRVRRHIATGGMASVWCADDRVLGRQVAIKVLSERFAHDEPAVRRFQREARAAARVSAHPHVVTIFDVGDIDHGRGELSPPAFIVMEYLAGGTVADALRCRTVERSEALRWLREAGSALDHAHKRGIVHRDIKPANFLLDRGCGLYVADFGIARLQSEDTITSTGMLFGTAAYLAPEQALGDEATGASDRYALAVAAFELLTGERPFTASHFAAQARQHIEDPPPRASERVDTLSQAVDAVLARGMAKEPQERYPTAGALIDALDASLDGSLEGVDGAQTASTRIRSDRPRRLTRPAAGAAFGAAVGNAASSPGRTGAKTTGRTAAGTTGRIPPGTLRPATVRRGHSPRRAAALVALILAALGVAVLITQLQGGSSQPAPLRTAGHLRQPTSTPVHHRHPAPQASQSTTTASASSSTSTAPPSASGLQLQGHQELLAGNYPAATATLRQALAASAPGSLTYAYTLYDLGRSLLLSGDPTAAVPVLEQRLKIPNQTPVVQALLNQALQASGQAPATPQQPAPGARQGSGGVGIPPGFDHGRGHHGPGGD
jgi:eukaryotic-like serine/threonine-protein kinase